MANKHEHRAIRTSTSTSSKHGARSGRKKKQGPTSTDKVEKRANGKIVLSQFTYKTVEEGDGGGSAMKPWVRSGKHCSLVRQHKNGRQCALRPGTHISECNSWRGCGNGPESSPRKHIVNDLKD